MVIILELLLLVVGQDILQSQSPVLQTHVEALRRKAGSNWLEELNKEVDVYNTKKVRFCAFHRVMFSQISKLMAVNIKQIYDNV